MAAVGVAVLIRRSEAPLNGASPSQLVGFGPTLDLADKTQSKMIAAARCLYLLSLVERKMSRLRDTDNKEERRASGQHVGGEREG